MTSAKSTWTMTLFVLLLTLGICICYALPRNNSASHGTAEPHATPTPEVIDGRDLSGYGIVGFDDKRPSNIAENQRREIIGRRYDNQEWVFSKINNPKVGGVGRIADLAPPPLFPFEQADLVALGEVIRVESYLSNDKGGVYTELTIRLTDSLKKIGGSQLKEVTADREGGVVLYPNGQRVLYQSSERGLPQLGSQYLFFLTKDPAHPNYSILTSYEFNNGKVLQVELGLPFDDYRHQDKASFLQTVRQKLDKPR